MAVQLAFRVASVHHSPYGVSEGGEVIDASSFTIQLQPVRNDAENLKQFHGNPEGGIELSGLTETAARSFQPGLVYRLTFEPQD